MRYYANLYKYNDATVQRGYLIECRKEGASSGIWRLIVPPPKGQKVGGRDGSQGCRRWSPWSMCSYFMYT